MQILNNTEELTSEKYLCRWFCCHLATWQRDLDNGDENRNKSIKFSTYRQMCFAARRFPLHQNNGAIRREIRHVAMPDQNISNSHNTSTTTAYIFRRLLFSCSNWIYCPLPKIMSKFRMHSQCAYWKSCQIRFSSVGWKVDLKFWRSACLEVRVIN